LIEAWRWELSLESEATALSAAPLWSLLEHAARVDGRRRRSSNPLVRHSATGVSAHEAIVHALAARARTRLVAMALALLACQKQKAFQDECAATAAAGPYLDDPFDERPLRWQRSANRRGLLLYSVGPNRRDDGGGDDDVAVTVTLRRHRR
jgi:hypothetical protein